MRIVEDVTTRKAWTKFHTSLLLVLLAIQLPEVHAFFEADSDLSWKVYFTANEVSKAVLCVALALVVDLSLLAFVAFYAGQALDEWYSFNVWADGWGEYVVLIVLAWLAWKRRTR